MAAKKDTKKENTEMNVDVALQNGGTITYATDVIAIIAGVAASEVDGVAGMCNAGGIYEMIGKNRNITRGIRVEQGTQEVAVDVFAVVEYGRPVHSVACDIQENVRKAIENMTGLHVVRVDVHVQGVSFEKEKAEQVRLEGAAETPVLTAAEGKPAAPVQKKTVKGDSRDAVKENRKETAVPEDTEERPAADESAAVKEAARETGAEAAADPDETALAGENADGEAAEETQTD